MNVELPGCIQNAILFFVTNPAPISFFFPMGELLFYVPR